MTEKEKVKLLADVMLRDHAKYGPSGIARTMYCPVSAYICSNLPPQEKTKASAQGTTAHDVAEMYTKDILNGEGFRQVDPDIYDDEMREHARAYAKYNYELVKPRIEKNDHIVNPPQYYAWWTERKIIGDLKRDLWGTADFLLLYQDENFDENNKYHMVINDYKYGSHVVVDTKNNWQLIGYAYCAIKTIEEKLQGYIDTVTTHIFQPRVDFKAEPVTYKVEDLEENYFPKLEEAIDFSETFFKKGHITEEEYKKHQNTGSWCMFCQAKKLGVCKAYIEDSDKKTISAFKTALSKGVQKKDLKSASKMAGVLDLETMAYITKNASSIKNMVDGVVKATKHVMLQGRKVPGLKVVEATPNRKLIDDEEKIAETLRELGVIEPYKTEKKLCMTMTDMLKKYGQKVEHLIDDSPVKEVSYKVVDEKSKGVEVSFEDNSRQRCSVFINAIKKSKK